MVQLQASALGPALLDLQRQGLHCDAEVRLCSVKAVMHYAVLVARCTALPCNTHLHCTKKAPKVVMLASEEEGAFTSLLSDSSRQHQVLEKFIEFLYGVEITLPSDLLPPLRLILSRVGCTLDVSEPHVNVGDFSTDGNGIKATEDIIREDKLTLSDGVFNIDEKVFPPIEELERVPTLDSSDGKSKNSYFPVDEVGHDGVTCAPFDHREVKEYRKSIRGVSTANNSSLFSEGSGNGISLNCTEFESCNDSNLSITDALHASGDSVSPSMSSTSLTTQELGQEWQQQVTDDDICKAVVASTEADEQIYGQYTEKKRFSDEKNFFSFPYVPDLSILTIGASEENSTQSQYVTSVENYSNPVQNSNEVEPKNTLAFLEFVPSVAVCNINSEGGFATSYPSLSNGLKDVLHNHKTTRCKESPSQPYFISNTKLNMTGDVISENSTFSIICEATHPLSSFEVVKSCLSSETTKSTEDRISSDLKHSNQNDFVPEELHCLSVPASDTPVTGEAVMQTSSSSSSTKRAVAVSTLVDSPFDSGSLTCRLQPNAFVPISGILPSSQGGLQCGHCQASFRKCSDLVKHVVSCLHFTETCPICLAKAPDVESQRSHFILHDSPLPFFCYGCDLRFRTRAHLAMHVPKHSSARPFSCPECSRAFKWRHALQAHLLTHRPMGHLLCDVCGFSSNYITTFKAHLQQHSGEAFACTQPGCSFKAFRKDNLKSHLSTHSNVRPHQCEVCGTSFSLFRNLRRHMRVHSGLRLQCSSCPFTTTRADKLRCHVSAKHHVALDPAKSGPQSDPAEQAPTQASVTQYTSVEEMQSENGVLEAELEVGQSSTSVNDHLVLSVRRKETKSHKSRKGDGIAYGQKHNRRKSSFRSTRVDINRMQAYSSDACLVGLSANEQASRAAQSPSHVQNDVLPAKTATQKRVCNKFFKKRENDSGTKRKLRPIYPKPSPVPTNTISFLESKLEAVSNDILVAVTQSDAR